MIPEDPENWVFTIKGPDPRRSGWGQSLIALAFHKDQPSGQTRLIRWYEGILAGRNPEYASGGLSVEQALREGGNYGPAVTFETWLGVTGQGYGDLETGEPDNLD